MKAKVYKLLRMIPVIGAIFRIANAYAYEGRAEGNIYVAPFRMWWGRIFKKMVFILLFTEMLVLINGQLLLDWSWEPADTIFSVFPSVLGFGIGVFALMFVMPSNFLQFLKDRRGTLSFGPEIVPVDMGYPLVVFVLVIVSAAINKIFPNGFLRFISVWAFFYGLAMAFELISFLFNTSYLIHKINEDNNEKS
ncbi:hypothetical protein [Serratia sp. 2723]|uniref:hypothetical protein n=1 Tax=unclassified Serratia (in: enterobacteria) TaxID=2647522 RepID=UPI003D1945AE